MLSELAALFIDVGGTLIHARGGVGGAYAEAAKELGVAASPEELGRRFRSVFERERDTARAAGRLAYGRDAHGARVFWRRVVGEVFRTSSGTPQQLETLFEALYGYFARPEAWEVYADTRPLLEAARARGLPVVAVSNWDARLPAILATVELAPWLTEVVGSFAIGAEKPDPRIFEAAIKTLPGAPERSRILHIGDSLLEDVRGAEAAGLRALHLDRTGAAPEGPGRITTLAALFA